MIVASEAHLRRVLGAAPETNGALAANIAAGLGGSLGAAVN